MHIWLNRLLTVNKSVSLNRILTVNKSIYGLMEYLLPIKEDACMA